MKRKSLPATVRHVCLIAIVLIACETFAGAATEKVLHQFVPTAQGASPQGTLVQDSHGNVYGVAAVGGLYGYGVVFELSTGASGKWVQKVIHNFTNANNSAYPYKLTIDTQGNLFGTAYGEGSGAVFELSPGANGVWTETVIHVFTNDYNTGFDPADIVVDSSGNVYGTAQGGIYNNGNTCQGYCGLVYRVSPSSNGWTYSVVYEFHGRGDNGFPSNLLVDAAGNLFGTTETGGVFELTPSSPYWTLTNPFTLQGIPFALVLDQPNTIYGFLGASQIEAFKATRASDGQWAVTILYSFAVGSNGVYPSISVDRAGNLYGTTPTGGTGCIYCGTVFKLSPSGGTWTETILHNFTLTNDGITPNGGVIIDSAGDLIGVTASGPEANYGAVYELAAGSYDETQLYGFPATDGEDIIGGLVADSVGNLYGVASQGGFKQCYDTLGSCGSIFKLTPQPNGTWLRTTLHNFTGTSDGYAPSTTLTFDSHGNLYGTTEGAFVDLGYVDGYSGGTVFELSPTSSGGWTFQTLFTFDVNGDTEEYPLGRLVFDAEGNLYGTTSGTVFRLAPSTGGTWTESILYNFDGNNESYSPTSGVTFDAQGNLYGTTSLDGGLGHGIVFELSPNSNGSWTHTTLYTFTGGSDGGYPRGGVILDSSGNLYGVTLNGGYSTNTNFCYLGCGVVYELTPTLNGPWRQSVLYTFQGQPDGFSPSSTLAFDAAGNLYGTTEGGGPESSECCGSGTIFKLTPSGAGWSESILYSFNGPPTDGTGPIAGVIFDSAGNIYGTTSYGGTTDYNGLSGGTVFEITP